MNKILITIAACLAVLGVVFAQVPGGFQDQERQRPAGAQNRAGGGNVAMTCNDTFLFVATNGTIIKYKADTMVKLSETKLPVVQREKGN